MRLSSIVFFDEKVSSVRDATDGAPAPQFTGAPIDWELRFFRPDTSSDVTCDQVWSAASFFSTISTVQLFCSAFDSVKPKLFNQCKQQNI